MPTVELPPPSPQQQAVSDHFVARLSAEISARGAIPFSDYMQRCLYEDGLGYYVNGFSKLGADGDFITAPEISDAFAFCLAQQCRQIFAATGGGNILEFGGGSGRLAADMLRALSEQDTLPDTYQILDVSAELQQSQKQLLESELPVEIFSKVQWLSALPEKFDGVVIANEVFDAFAVERFSIHKGEPNRLMVNCNDNGFYFEHQPDVDVQRQVRDIQQDIGTDFSDGYLSEYCPLINPWFESLSECVNKGALIVCDYGTDRRQYYSVQKSNGSLRCFFRHALHDDPFARPAIQDITADVDFTAVASAAVEAGFDLQGYSPMSEFMLSLGVLEHHEQKVASLSTAQKIIATGDLKRLILSQEMGDRFMVIGFSKGVDQALQGFSRADWSRLL